MKTVQAGDREILLLNLATGMDAINNIRTHRGCRLSGGPFEGDTVHRPCHGSAFRIKTSEVVKRPCKNTGNCLCGESGE